MSNIFAEFLVNDGLYSKITVNKDNIEQLCDLLDGKEKLSHIVLSAKKKECFL